MSLQQANLIGRARPRSERWLTLGPHELGGARHLLVYEAVTGAYSLARLALRISCTKVSQIRVIHFEPLPSKQSGSFRQALMVRH